MLDKKMDSLRYASNGIKVAAREEANFKMQIFLGIIAIVFGLVFHITRTEWLFVFGSAGLVLTAELLNTALEELCDMLKPQHDPHVAKIKDLAAAAVLTASTTALLIGCFIFIPHIFGV